MSYTDSSGLAAPWRIFKPLFDAIQILLEQSGGWHIVQRVGPDGFHWIIIFFDKQWSEILPFH